MGDHLKSMFDGETSCRAEERNSAELGIWLLRSATSSVWADENQSLYITKQMCSRYKTERNGQDQKMEKDYRKRELKLEPSGLGLEVSPFNRTPHPNMTSTKRSHKEGREGTYKFGFSS